MSFLKELNEKFPSRKKEKQKKEFRDYVLNFASENNIPANVETLQGKHNNVILGNIDEAKVVFCAHYDTPATAIIPNVMFPKDSILKFLIVFGVPLLMALIALGIAYFLAGLITEVDLFGPLYLVIYFAIYWLAFLCFENKHNANDNTSGVATVLSLIKNTNKKNEIAVVLFDNEEKGLLGSKAFSKAHDLKNKLVINCDCVANGDQVLFLPNKKTQTHEHFELLKDSVASNEEFCVEFLPSKGLGLSSDHKSFENGVCVTACHKKGSLYVCGRIHTPRDTVANQTNVDFLVEQLSNFIEKI